MITRITCALLLLPVVAAFSLADGLVFKVPDDKTAAVYGLEFNLESNGKKLVQKGTVTIASVGQAEVSDVKLRWLEIAIKISEGEEKYRMIFKVLIAEKFLQEGGSPSECILKCWWARKIRPDEDGKNLKAELLEKHPHDERWSYLPTLILTGSLNDKKRLEGVEMGTPFGKAVCYGVSGKFDYEQETRHWQTKVETRLHPKSPFGVVSSRVEFTMRREPRNLVFTGVALFTLTEVLQNYEGELPTYK